MDKAYGKGRWVPCLFFLGALCGTAAGLYSPLPELLREYAPYEAALSTALFHALLPMLPALAVGRSLFPAALLLRACTLSWTLTLLLRAGQIRSAAFFCVSLLFLLPAFLLLPEIRKERTPVPSLKAEKDASLSGLLFFLLWFAGSAIRFFLPRII